MDLETTAFIGLALFNQQANSVRSVGEESRRACMEAIRKRIDAIPTLVAKNQSLMPGGGLVRLAGLVDAFTQRAQSAEGMNFILDESPLYWYMSYCLSLVEFGEALQDAVKNKRLTLRNSNTRLPLRDDEMNWWLGTSLRAMYERIDLIPACAGWDQLHSAWPDATLFPPGVVKESGAEEWAVSIGLIQPGELHTLLLPNTTTTHNVSGVINAPLTSLPVSQNNQAGGSQITTYEDLKNFRNSVPRAKWNEEMKVILAEEKKARQGKPGATGVSSGLAGDLKVSVQVVNKKVSEGNAIIKSRKTSSLSVIRHKA